MGRQVRTSVATVSLSGSLEEKVTAIAAAGFDGFEVFEPDFVSSPWSPRELASRAADLGLTLDLYQPFRDLDSVDVTTFARNLIRAERKFDIMEQLGCDTLLVCSSPLPEAVRDDARLTEQLHTLAERAHSRGLRIAYEALAWGTHVNTYRHAWKIVQDADHPALGTCLDSFHILSRGDDPSGIRDIPGRRSSSSNSPTRPACRWTSCSGAGTTGTSRGRATSISRRSARTSRPLDTPDRGRSRSSTTRSGSRPRGARPPTRTARCCTSRRRSHACRPSAVRTPVAA